MRTNDRIILVLLLIVFLITAGMFYYQNFYSKMIEERNQVTVYVAIKDIPAGGEINPNNIGALKIDKDKVFPTYVTNIEDINGKKAKSDILKDEIININKVDDDKIQNRMFSVKMKANYMSDIQKGDNIRVYVEIFDKKLKKVSTFLLFDKKEIKSLYEKTDRQGKTTIEAFEIHCSDEESVNYYNAIKVGEIIALKFNDISEKDKLDVPKFEINSPAVRQMGIDYSIFGNPQGESIDVIENQNIINSSEEETEDEELTNQEITQEATDIETQLDNLIPYQVSEGETWESIAKQFGTTVARLKEVNPGLIDIAPGQVINISLE